MGDPAGVKLLDVGGGDLRLPGDVSARSLVETPTVGLMRISPERLMASAAMVVGLGYAVRLIGVALLGVSISGSVALFVVNMAMLVSMVTFVLALSTWIVKVGVKAAR